MGYISSNNGNPNKGYDAGIWPTCMGGPAPRIVWLVLECLANPTPKAVDYPDKPHEFGHITDQVQVLEPPKHREIHRKIVRWVTSHNMPQKNHSVSSSWIQGMCEQLPLKFWLMTDMSIPVAIFASLIHLYIYICMRYGMYTPVKCMASQYTR